MGIAAVTLYKSMKTTSDPNSKPKLLIEILEDVRDGNLSGKEMCVV
jgi:hypothetical protein